ncbi:MAG: DUF2252 family protein [Burkholderiaceae bacterium]
MKHPDPDQRSAHLIDVRNIKMARSSHAYVRGSTVKFYEWLATSAARIPDGPPIWICGDCHIGNMGPLANARGRVALQVRDLDQTVIGNPTHDLVRLSLSLASAARGSDLSGIVTVRILEAVMRGYEEALRGSFAARDPDGIESRTVRRLIRQSSRRRWRHLAQERLASVRPLLPLGRRFWTISDDERAAIQQLFDEQPLHALVGALQGREDPNVEVVDAAYWMKGCSSLGRLRYAVMLRVGRGDDASLCLMDVKEAVTAAAPRTDAIEMPRDNAVRVVTGANALSPYLGERMIARRLLDKGVVIRELMPQDLKLEVEKLTDDEALPLARHLANVLGRAHGRQLDDTARRAWRSELKRARSSSIDAPTWLWRSVVELLAIHEGAYLEHCRRFALLQAA